MYLFPKESKQVSKMHLIFCADKIKTLYIHSTKLFIPLDANSKKEHICFFKTTTTMKQLQVEPPQRFKT